MFPEVQAGSVFKSDVSFWSAENEAILDLSVASSSLQRVMGSTVVVLSAQYFV